MDILGTTSSSLWIGIKLTIFFKKQFEWRLHVLPLRGLDSAIVILLLSQLWLGQVLLLQIINVMVTFLSARMDMFSMLSSREERVKSCVLAFSVLVPWISEHGSYALPSLFILFGTTQFLRWPEGLKNSLREVRINFGPAYVLIVIGTWLKNVDGVFSNKFLLVAALCSFVAAIFLRPDNAEILKLFRFPVPNPVQRMVSHGFLMLISFLCMTLHILCGQTFPSTYCKIAVGAASIVNLLLFFGVAVSPYILRDAVKKAISRLLKGSIWIRSGKCKMNPCPVGHCGHPGFVNAINQEEELKNNSLNRSPGSG